ncbi:ankyrin repeat-containing domain protein [Aspergillus californicus]
MEFLSLPQEIIFLIASNLESVDLLRLLQTNHYLYNILLRELRKNDVKTSGGMALSFYAFYGDEAGVIDMLDLGTTVDLPNPRYRDHPPLVLAVSRHHASVVRVLIDRGADVNHSISYRTPLETAIRMAPSDDLSMIELLLDRGADVNLKGNKSRTALSTAVLLGKPETVALLLARGADVNARDCQGHTALKLARGIKPHSPEKQQWLLHAGATE